MSFAPTLQCPCEGKHLVPAFAYDAPPPGETRFSLGQSPYRRSYRSCALCGHWFGAHALDLSSLYEREYVDSTYGGREGMRARFEKIMALPVSKSDNAGRVARVNAFVRGLRDFVDVPRLLDVGAGLGVFPAAMKKIGWAAIGVEPDARTAAHLAEIAGVEAIVEDLLTLRPEQIGLFDLVTFNKVLEHVENPVPLLAHAATLLTKDGLIYVELPDVAAALEGPSREEFFVEHHHVFSPASVVLMAQRAKLSALSVERLREPSRKYTVFAFLAGAT